MRRFWNFTRRHSLLWRRVAFASLWLHGTWEIVQCFVFYDMSRVSVLSRAAWMSGATLADVGITLGLVGATVLIFPFQNHRLSPPALLFLMALGALTALLLEILAQKAGWWRYAPAMPTLLLGDHAIGIAPLLQMTILPALAASLPLRR